MELTKQQLNQLLTYDPGTGALVWQQRDRSMFKCDRSCKVWNTRYAGKVTGTVTVLNGKSYIVVRLFKKQYLAHRLIWLLVTGETPVEIDHEDSNGLNNAWDNLRNVTHRTNCKNVRLGRSNTSGVMGVHWCNRDKRWVARIHVDGRTVGLGYFKDKQDAIDARLKAEVDYGFHENHGAEKNEVTHET